MVVLLALVGCGRFGFDEPDAGGSIDAPGEPGLVVWYRMDDDPTDGQLDDSAGGDHVALCAPGLSCGTTVPGVRGAALRLAPQQFYRLPFEAALVTPSSFTVALWLQANAIGPMVFVTKRYDAIYNSWGINWSPATEVAFESARPGSGAEFAYTQPLSVGTWIHVAISWDDMTKRIYLNGVRFVEDVPTDIAFDAGEVLLGCDQDGPTRLNYVSGLVDDVRIYDRVLGDAEIRILAQP